LATPAAMLSAAGALARRGVLVRRLDAFESLAGVDTLMFDKTGTLTQDALRVDRVQVRPGLAEADVLAQARALAKHSLHPASRALVAASPSADDAACWSADQVQEFAGQGVRGRVFMAGDSDFESELRLGSSDFCQISGDQADGAGPKVFVSDQNGWLATVWLQESVRVDAERVVSELKELEIEVRLLSGDASSAAQRVAERVGIVHYAGQCTPQDKLDFMRHAQQAGRKVAVVGDGLNDGPVLAGAHVSFAFGQAVPLTQAKADFLISSSRLTDVSDAVKLARRTLGVVRQNLWWAAIYNAVCVPLAIAGLLPAWLAGIGMASSSLLVVLNALRLSREAEATGKV